MAFKVLVVDDSPAMRKMIRRVLDLSGIELGECLEAGDGQQALDLLRTHWVDIVLTDINMPVMNGEQFLREISRDTLLESIPVMVISTDRTEARIERMKALGARDYVTKPFVPEALGRAMERVLLGEERANCRR
jgi:two-component system, chemotaxis family, chemotaxis protein CheY